MTTLPESVRAEVESALRASGQSSPVAYVRSIGGGCINHGSRIELASGDAFFLKWNPSAPPDMFAAEEDGLRALRDACAEVRVPAPVARSGTGAVTPWLLLEYVEPGRSSKTGEEALGRGLAALHGSPSEDVRYGWERDNWIGSLPQENDPCDSWAEFWRDRRIVPQLASARRSGTLATSTIGSEADATLERLVDLLPAALDGVERPALLHGDLWSGNAFYTPDVEPVLIDPAVYRGDGEVDLAMTELFGGFGPSFYDAYRTARPLSDAYASHRRDTYQLYYLLVHVNLFGASYRTATLATASRVVSALS